MRFRSMRVSWVFACCVVLAAFAGAAQPGQESATVEKVRPNPPEPKLPDANDQMRMREENAKKVNFEAANAERKKQIADDSANLLKLANDLKTEVDKTSKDTLSLSVIRKAEEIERLAHAVKEKMKLTVGGS